MWSTPGYGGSTGAGRGLRVCQVNQFLTGAGAGVIALCSVPCLGIVHFGSLSDVLASSLPVPPDDADTHRGQQPLLCLEALSTDWTKEPWTTSKTTEIQNRKTRM